MTSSTRKRGEREKERNEALGWRIHCHPPSVWSFLSQSLLSQRCCLHIRADLRGVSFSIFSPVLQWSYMLCDEPHEEASVTNSIPTLNSPGLCGSSSDGSCSSPLIISLTLLFCPISRLYVVGVENKDWWIFIYLCLKNKMFCIILYISCHKFLKGDPQIVFTIELPEVISVGLHKALTQDLA